MAEIYRVEKGSEEWKYKAYDYVRTDAFCLGQNIPIELEFGQDESKDDLQAILLTEDHKPVAGCRIAFPAEKTGKIERVCVVREKQKSGYGRVLIEAAEKWLKEYGVDHIVITSQDRAAGFYEKLDKAAAKPRYKKYDKYEEKEERRKPTFDLNKKDYEMKPIYSEEELAEIEREEREIEESDWIHDEIDFDEYDKYYEE